MSFVMETNSQFNKDDDLISQEYGDNEIRHGKSMKASTFLNLTMLNDREVQSEYNAQQNHPKDHTELKLNVENKHSDFL